MTVRSVFTTSAGLYLLAASLLFVSATIRIKGWEIAAYDGNWSKLKNIQYSEFVFDAPEEEIAQKCQELLEITAKL
jgi:hypothetical protein